MADSVEKFTVSELEKKTNFMVKDTKKYPLNKQYTLAEYEDLVRLPETHHDFIEVDQEARVKYLKDNGYDVTRENMIDGDLPAKAE